MRAGDPRGAEAALRRTDGKLYDPDRLAQRRLHHGHLDLMRGRVGAAEATALDVLGRAREVGSGMHDGEALSLLFGVRWFQGRAAERLVDAEAAPPESDEEVEAAVALIQLEAGREQHARDTFRRLAERSFEPRVETDNEPIRLFCLAQLCQRLGGERDAVALERHLAPFLTEHLVGWQCRYVGSSLHWKGILAATAGRHDEAIDWFDRAIDAYRDLEAVARTAKAHSAKAQSLEARGAQGDADRREAPRRGAGDRRATRDPALAKLCDVMTS